MPGDVSFIELGVEDAERGRAFYEALFGWRFTPSPSGHGFAFTTPSSPGGMHGGDRGAAPYVFFRVDDMDAALAHVRRLGGTVDEANVEGDEESVARFERFRLCRAIRDRRSACTSPRPARARPRPRARPPRGRTRARPS